MRKNFKPLAMSFLAAAASIGIVVGGTFALFTDNASSSIELTAGKIELSLTTDNLVTYSVTPDPTGDREDENGAKYSSVATAVNGTFTNLGTASLVGNVLTLDRITPGDRVVFDATIGDTSNVSFLYRLKFQLVSTDTTLGAGMKTTTDISGTSTTYSGLKTFVSAWTLHTYDSTNPLSATINFDMELPVTLGNTYQEKEAEYEISVEAVQGNAAVSDESTVEVLMESFQDTQSAVASTPTVLSAANSDSSVSAQVTIPADTTEVPAGSEVTMVVSELELTTGTDSQTLNFDLAIYVDGVETTSFSSPIAVELYIGKYLEITQMKHNSTVMNPANYSYDASTGIVTFSTASLSPFSVTYAHMTRNTAYGFYDSRVQDGKWVHEVSTKAELANILAHIESKAGQTAADDFHGGSTAYPLADETTVYLLKNDIDAEDAALYSDGYAPVAFTGVFDGDGHTISNVAPTVFATQIGDKDVACLFNKVGAATFKDFTLSGCVLNDASAKPGGLVAGGRKSSSAYAAIVFENVTIDSTCSVNALQGVGAFMGYARGSTDLTFTNCVNDANVIGTGANIGGFVGSCTGNAGRTWVFTNCTNNGNVGGSYKLGGFIGTSLGGANLTFTNCTNNGNTIPSGTGADVGPFIGSNDETVTYTECYNAGYLKYSSDPVKTNILVNHTFSTSTDLSVIKYEGWTSTSTKGDFANKFVVSTSIEELSLDFNHDTHAMVLGTPTVEYDNAVFTAAIGSIDRFYTANSKWADNCGSNPVKSITSANLSDITSFVEVTRAGWFAPNANVETGSFLDSEDAAAKEWYEKYRLADELKDNYETGYYTDDNGGYYILNNPNSGDTYDQIKEIWLCVEYRLVLYKDGATVATATYRSSFDGDGRNPYIQPLVLS
ncbi:MAG: SipW-dependent-type signal peptide-containing protein [Bacilli bacterium]|nr:SipW-dependent-type signal peptide-containing protein [Bacilli bacterium]